MYISKLERVTYFLLDIDDLVQDNNDDDDGVLIINQLMCFIF